ncbi:hypothetical protein Mal64_37810 [Pseudobythopirellula maris]|uniref:DNA primase/polymerase bifunctional N-terminal domain-containing protein n=1 Tax=Pseudobythopirellula maris TaxID=2527991 RepID=A0A5C5ZFY7_9BACT|nr:DUF3987 domain-containing protein [Pseudobythopirellula maris]TWT86242.1 hypothetical protein Mal64_37810 [Pseudobythopirellula maris]
MSTTTLSALSVETLRESALRYASLGYRVFPCKPGGKAPAVARGFHEATTDEKQIAAWWSQGVAYNIGVATEGLLVVDVDGPTNPWLTTEGGAELLLGDAPAVRTPRGGWHVWLRAPAGVGLRNTAGKLAEMVDTRAAGGYVVAAPSAVAGKPYRWVEGRGPVAVGALPEPPRWLVERLTARPKTTATPGVNAAAKPSAGGVSDANAPVAEGQRNAALASLAGSLRRAGLGEPALLAALVAENARRCRPPLDEQEVAAIARSVARYAEGPRKPSAPAWRPLPVESLGGVLAEFVDATARSQVVDPSMVALPLLAALAGAIGASRRVAIKPDWCEPSILWCALVAPSGSGKTPAAAPVLRVVRDRDARAVRENERLLAEHREDCERHDAERRRNKTTDRGARPERPPLVRYHLQDVTPEQLLAVLVDNPRGVLVVRDELSGLFGGFGRYSDGKGAAERAKYLSVWSAEHLSDDRKQATSCYVRRPHVSIYGGVQPDVLFRSLGDDDVAAGLPARFLFARPPERSRRWSDASTPHELSERVAGLFDRLYALPMGVDAEGDPAPVDLPLTGGARRRFRAWHDETHAPRVEGADGALRAALSKLPAYVGRLALVLRLARWAAEGDAAESDTHEGAGPAEIDGDSVDRAITLVEWFAHEASRVYSLRGESAGDRETRRLVEWIERRGGEAAPRDVQAGCRWLRTPGAAEGALTALAEEGLGEWRVERTATNARRVLRLSAASASTDSHEPRDLAESADADTPAERATNGAAPTDATECERCGSRSYRDTPIHDGRSVRRDCAQCGRTLGHPVWAP